MCCAPAWWSRSSRPCSLPRSASGRASSTMFSSPSPAPSCCRLTRSICSLSTSIYFVGHPVVAQLEGRTLGLIGLGAIGSRVAVLARPFGMRMLASTFGPAQGRAAALGAQHVPVEQLLRESDIVSLHLRLSADTQGYLGKERLALMKPTAFLINTARGGLVDKQALIDALRDKRLAGAALDVFHEEPIPPGDPLLALPELVLTPHNGGMTREVIDGGVLRAVENIQLFLDGRTRDVVVAPPVR